MREPVPDQELSFSELVGLSVLLGAIVLPLLFFGAVGLKQRFIDAPRAGNGVSADEVHPDLNPNAFTEECLYIRGVTSGVLDRVRTALAPDSTVGADERHRAASRLRKVASDSLAREYELWVIHHARSDVDPSSPEAREMRDVMGRYQLRIWEAHDCLIGKDENLDELDP